jgi:hypothetical protein
MGLRSLGYPQEVDPVVKFGPKIGVLLDSSLSFVNFISPKGTIRVLPESLI